MLNSIPGQEKSFERLYTMFVKGTVPHALLFSGIEGIGKEDTAIQLALAVNCQSQNTGISPDRTGRFQLSDIACMACRSCKKIISGNHPDLLQIHPSGNLIKIAQVRELINSLLLKNYEARYRVVIISNADKMNKEASNALLKVLEEPPKDTFFILTSCQPSDLLPTILSRCQNIGFSPVSSENIRIYLNRNYDLPKGADTIITALATGNIKKAVLFAEDSVLFNRTAAKRLWTIDEFNGLRNRPLSRCLLFAEKMAEKKDDIFNILETLLTYTRDLLIQKFEKSAIINHDLAEMIYHQSSEFTVESLLKITDQIRSAQKDIKANASLRLTLESMVINIARV